MRKFSCGDFRKRWMYSLLFLMFVISCADYNDVIHLQADNVHGLKKDDVVDVNGLKVGQVSDIGMDPYGRILISLDIDKPLKLSTDSEFKIVDMDQFGGKGISILPGDGDVIITVEDILSVTSVSTNHVMDSLAVHFQKVIENFTTDRQKDSILFELRRLNNNLEELKRKNK